MKRSIITTNDGSTTIHLAHWNETYHSKHGAIQEAYHVFIKNGLALFDKQSISILEVGFGTGLNCFITYLESFKNDRIVHYTGVEAYPIDLSEAIQMNYPDQIGASEKNIFKTLHECAWNQENSIASNFILTKRKQFFQEINDIDSYNLIYFDAFGYRVQPELWSDDIFIAMYKALKNNGVLVTYACRTSIKKAMLSAGFYVEKLPGAPGKREMLRAIKK